MKKYVIRKCDKCGAMVEVIKDCTCDNCGILCCGTQMREVRANSVDAAVEKHKPTYEVVGQYIVASVNHVMEDDHYIDYLVLVGDNVNAKKYLQVGKEPKAIFPYIPGSTLYAYCNKHGLWETEVK